MIIAIVAGGLLLVGMGILIGYRICDHQDKAIFQALINQGQMVVRGDDEWVGMPEAFKSILLRMGKGNE